MGRRPNALVSEYFSRGAKCSDTSNRYSHTCKGCGENFPKGRVDSLMSHLLRRCSNTSQVQRNFIYHAIQQQNPTAPTNEDGGSQSPRQAVDGDVEMHSEVPPPMLYQHQQQSALDTLAEVSRQHLDITTHDRPNQQAHVDQILPASERQDPQVQFLDQLREAVKAGPDAPPVEDGPRSTEKASDMDMDIDSSGHQPKPLVETASAANDQLEQTLSGQENLDPALEDHPAPLQANPHMHKLPEAGPAPVRPESDGPSLQRSPHPHGLPGFEQRRPQPHGLPEIQQGSPQPHGLPEVEQRGSQPHDMTVVEPSHASQAQDESSEERPIALNEASLSNHHEPMSWIPTNGPVEAHPPSHNLSDVMATAKQPMSFLPNNGIAVPHTFTENLSDVMAASKQPMPGFGPLRNSTKARSKFTDNRRKQVQEIRKRGACIRCRMLKKPCSEGTPCNTCKTVGSARLWKGSCLRTRLADEFTLWSAGLFDSRAKAAVTEVQQVLERTSTEAFLEVCFFPNSGLNTTLPARKYAQNSLARQAAAQKAYSGADPDLILRAQFEAHTDSPPVYLLEEQAEVLPKLEFYINQCVDTCISSETSPFLQATLQRAQTMIHEEQETSTTTPSNGSARACYTFQNQLLRNVVELWVSTTILTRPETSTTFQQIRLPAQEEPQQPTPPTLLPHNLSILHSQLLSALESRSAHLSKTTMNELERRLLQRQQVSRLATFISAVILLNCVERMTAFFHNIASEEEEEEEENISSPLCWPQGSHFADLLIMLLRMRGLPPKTTRNAEGRLVVIIPTSTSISASKRLENEALEAAGEWLDPLELNFNELVKARDDESVVGWDMRFIARALLPPIK